MDVTEDESNRPGAREGNLAELFSAASLHDVESTALEISREHPTFEEWWEPYVGGVGPAGAYVSGWTPSGRPSCGSAVARCCRGPVHPHLVRLGGTGRA